MFQNVGEMLVLFLRTVRALPLSWRHRRKIFEQLFEIGNASLLMACILSLFIGGRISLQSGPVLRERGLATALGGLVGLSLCKELAPVMMSILIAGRIGSALAAENGLDGGVVALQGTGAGDDVDFDRGADRLGDGGGNWLDGGVPGDRCFADDEYQSD